MTEISDIANEFIRDEIEEFIEREDERGHIVDLFAQASERMQNISAALICHIQEPWRQERFRIAEHTQVWRLVCT